MGKRLLLMLLLAGGVVFAAYAQNEKKLSAGTRMIIAEREGKISFKKPDKPIAPWQDRKLIKQKSKLGTGVSGSTGTVKMESDDDGLPVVEPFTENGVKKVQVWIKMTDNNTSAIQALGADITSTFDKLIIANVPVDALEKIAELKNVVKVSAAKKMQKKTYYARQKTNVDDVLNYTADAQTAGLLQAYNGQDVVLGIIDTGIQFDHVMFKDENGNTRIKKACVYANNQLNWYTGSAINNLTYDVDDEDHGSHTSSIAGGSNYEFTGYYYDNDAATYQQATITYGGMAPKVDLVLCGLAGELTDANISACIQGISEYADQVGKPCVISISLGSQAGPHDGTGNMADVCAQYTGQGKVIVYAASNDGDENVYLYGNNVTKNAPIMSLLNCTALDGYVSGTTTYNNYYLYGGAASYARTPNVELAARAYVVDITTNTIVWVSNEYTDDIEMSTSTNGSYGGSLGTYFSAATNGGGYLCFYFDQEDSGKRSVQTLVYYLQAKSYTTSGSTRTGKYKIGVSYYPRNNGASTIIDSWGTSYTYFDSGSASYSGTTYNFVAGDGKCSVSDEATFPAIIPVGAYTSGKGFVAADGYVYTVYGDVDDITGFSSYQETGYGPLGTNLPWITAPGNSITAAYNRADVGNQESSLIYGYDSSNPIGAMSGTSMATPCAAGIVALWLQADPTLTPADVKNIMAVTAIKDSYTTNAQFGPNGKIDALAGIEYILANDDSPKIGATPTSVNFSEKEIGTYTETVVVKGSNLQGNITATLTDANGIYSIDKTTITKANAESTEGVALTITYSPSVEGSTSATVTLSSAGAADVTINITGNVNSGGKASDAYLDIAKYATIDDQGWNTSYVTTLYKYTEYADNDVAWLTLPVYGAWSTCYYDNHPQKWIESNVNTNNTVYTGRTWTNNATYTDPYLGSSNYFTTATSRVMGTGSTSATTASTVTFYVTNTTAVKLYGYNGSRTTRNGQTYPTSLTVYECTENGDGTLTASTTAITGGTQSSATNNTAVNLTVNNLDATKIYKVVSSQIRGYLYEIGFQTPISKPAIVANPTTLNFNTTTGVPVIQTFNVKGSKLKGVVSATLTDANGVYSLDANSISISDAEANAGKNITVTFNPATAGTYTGTITLSSTDATSVTVNLNGVATTPAIVADPTTLTMTCEAGKTTTATFEVLATDLYDVVTATLTDANGVFCLDANSISIADAENGKTVTVTFAPSAQGEYSGTVTISSPYAESATVTINATATKAYPDFFDVTISPYGLSTFYLDFPVQIPYDTYDPDLLGVYYVYSIVGNEVKLARLNNVVPANVGVIVQGNAGTYRFPKTVTDYVLPRESYMSGVVEDATLADIQAANPGATILTLAAGPQGYVGFYKFSGSMIPAYKAFLPFIGESSAKGLNVSIIGNDGEATGIRVLKVDTDDADAWYSVQGQRLNGRPNMRGVYIHGGKAVVVK